MPIVSCYHGRRAAVFAGWIPSLDRMWLPLTPTFARQTGFPHHKWIIILADHSKQELAMNRFLHCLWMITVIGQAAMAVGDTPLVAEGAKVI